MLNVKIRLILNIDFVNVVVYVWRKNITCFGGYDQGAQPLAEIFGVGITNFSVWMVSSR